MIELETSIDDQFKDILCGLCDQLETAYPGILVELSGRTSVDGAYEFELGFNHRQSLGGKLLSQVIFDLENLGEGNGVGVSVGHYCGFDVNKILRPQDTQGFFQKYVHGFLPEWTHDMSDDYQMAGVAIDDLAKLDVSGLGKMLEGFCAEILFFSSSKPDFEYISC